jgi:hypothetical protein
VDKKLGNDFGEYQIPGEIVGTALLNYQRVKVAQTIFAIRVICIKLLCIKFSFKHCRHINVSQDIQLQSTVLIFQLITLKAYLQVA